MMIKVQAASARTSLAAVWAISFTFAAAVPLFLLIRHGVEWPSVHNTLSGLSDIYIPYLGATLTYYFAAHSRRPSMRIKKTRGVGAPFFLGLLMSLLWNLAVLVPFAMVLSGSLRVEEALDAAQKMNSDLKWLVAPAMGYFFAMSFDLEEAHV